MSERLTLVLTGHNEHINLVLFLGHQISQSRQTSSRIDCLRCNGTHRPA